MVAYGRFGCIAPVSLRLLRGSPYENSSFNKKLIAPPVGNSAKLDCSADGYPTPRVAWYKNGKPFNERRGSSLYLDWKYVLALKEVVRQINTYSCNVSNLLGWINHSYYLDVYGKVLI